MKIQFTLLLALVLVISLPAQEATKTKDVLLIGTFHYNNPGADVAKTKSFDILSENAQEELQMLTKAIKGYNPTKIFVEWPYDEQKELDSLYQKYLEGTYFQNDSLSDFYKKNEIFQLAFRVAKANNIKQVHGIDYKTSFPFDEVLESIEKNKQEDLKEQLFAGISKFTQEFDDKIASGISLTELTLYLNNPEMRAFSNDFHTNLMLGAGAVDDFSGPLLTAEWYKRNLYMWSFVQKQTTIADERIMVLAGASHVAMFELFVNEDKRWTITELSEVVGK
ncbi:DUF5694 domain-containing protein [Croceivirga thetidis]|uniref:TraB/GumN family protein n=1 Tax=Croceivirga thetidis TaxID=2721623 RepID=A0ABX1GSQ5_9FLAO|nr:DUF5694 domain-containing protein [Croceivirga thetidis]NKI32956.1 hypothetical protein [Croceivirga thetidis]